MIGLLQVAYRFDIGELKSPRLMPDGRLVVEAKLTRTGIFDYQNLDGSVRKEFRSPEQVFDKDSLDTYLLASVTNDHPEQMVNVTNAAGVTVGMVTGTPRRLDDHVAAELVIFDEQAIKDIRAGKTEISCGYHADVTDVPGTTEDGEHFDSEQQNIRINHVAIVDVGRAGPEARIRMDAWNAPTKPKRNDATMTELEKAQKQVNDLMVEKATETARADRAEGLLTEAKAKTDTAEAERDVAKEAAEKAVTAREDSDKGLNGRVNALVKLRCDAHSIVPKESDDQDSSRFDGKSEREIKCQVIKAVQNFDCTEDHSDDYVNARFDAAVEVADKSDDALSKVRLATEITRVDVDKNSSEAARQRMIKRLDTVSKGSQN